MNFLLVVVLLGCISATASDTNDTRAVYFSTIPPRFDKCIATIKSWLNQTIIPTYVVITVVRCWDPGRIRRGPLWSLSNHTESDADKLRRIIYTNFPVEYGQDKIIVIESPKDYGPASKFVGLLNNYHLFNTVYWIVGDDDLIYKNETIEKYETKFKRSTPNLETGPVYTHFNSKLVRFSLKIADHVVHVPQLQGADTYAIPSALLHRHSRRESPISYAKYILFLEYLYSRCPDSYFNDDFLLSYALAVSRIPVISLASGN